MERYIYLTHMVRLRNLARQIILVGVLQTFVQGFVPVIAEMLIHFCFGEKRALLGQEISKGHAEFFLELK